MTKKLSKLKKELLTIRKNSLTGGIISKEELEGLAEGLSDEAKKDLFNCYNMKTQEFIYDDLKEKTKQEIYNNRIVVAQANGDILIIRVVKASSIKDKCIIEE